MKPNGTYRQSAKNAHAHVGKAAESSRNHARDLKRMTRTGEDAGAMLKDGQKRQRKREEVKADAELRLATVKEGVISR